MVLFYVIVLCKCLTFHVLIIIHITIGDSERSGNDSDEDDASQLQVICQPQELQSNLFSIVFILHRYFMNYHDENALRTSQLGGYGWVMETLNTHGEAYKMIQMNENIFIILHDLLVIMV